MRILIAPDKFKGSLGASAVAQNIALGLREVLPQAEIALLPVADGGEGTAEVICAGANGIWQQCDAHDPLGGVVAARYCTIDNRATAVMEMSAASGLWLVPREQRDPERASSFGTGEMLLAAARSGAREIIIGLGGSATNDVGYGMARALGFRFHDVNGVDLKEDVSSLLRLARIVPPLQLQLPRIIAASDVRNPLLGERGATRTFAVQKGATPAQLDGLELAVGRLADVASLIHGSDPRNVPGAGAAGGLGFALMVFCGAEMRSGFEVVAERIGLEQAVEEADVIITGEGRLDAQTLEGKAPAGVARLAREWGKSIYAIVGEAVVDGAEARMLFDGIFPLVDAVNDLERAMTRGAELLRLRGAELGRLLSGNG